MNADGTEVRQLTNNDDYDSNPAWSSDGEHIAFESSRDGDHEIFVMNADGSEVRQLTDNDDSDYSPSWSPDGEHIAFESDRDGAWEVFVMAADGTEVRQLTDNEDDDGSPSWSPDGEHIAFQKLPPIEESSLSPSQQAEVARLQQEARDFPETAALNTLEMRRIRNNARLRSREVFVMNPDGTEVRQLTDNDDADGRPSWSSDGEHIVFVGNRDGDAEIFVMNSDGTEVRQFTDFDDLDFVPSFSNLPTGPTWSPDGKRIAFQSDRYGDAEVFVMNADGTGVYSTGQKGGSPSWGG
jgi:Tol biopolymer transport system component